MTTDLAEAQDIVQEAYLRAWQNWQKVSDYEDPAAWLRTVAWRLAVNRQRKLRTARVWLATRAPDSGTLQVEGPEPDSLAILAALRRVPLDQRRVLVLHHLVGLTVAEIAKELGIPSGTVKSRLSRGREALLSLFGQVPEEQVPRPPTAAT